MTRFCIDCEYAEAVEASPGILICHRYAPRPVPISEATGEKPAWPVVMPEDWCGEFLEREPDEEV